MKALLILFTVITLQSKRSNAQCEVPWLYFSFEDAVWSDCVTYGGLQLCEGMTAEPGWTYSWSPASYLNNPNIIDPIALPPVGVPVTYTLTASGPGCGPFNAGSITVLMEPAKPSISPGGPLTYYYPFEAVDTIILRCSGSYPTWYKNGVAVQYAGDVADPNQYVVTFTGDNHGTDVYKVYNHFSCTPWSDSLSLTYHGCEDGDYPVTVQQYRCLSEFPITVTQPNMGTNATYYWSNVVNPTCYAFSNITDVYDNTATFAPVSCSNYAEGIKTKAIATNGTEVRMNIGVGVNTGCRMASSGDNNKATAVITSKETSTKVNISNTRIYPNPASSYAMVESAVGISSIELFDQAGVMIKKVIASNTSTYRIDTRALRPGVYLCKIITEEGISNIKLVVTH